MAETWTLYLPEVPDESGVVWVLGPELDAAWFPRTHHWSIDTDGGGVYVYLDTHVFLDVLEPGERAALPTRLGFVPRSAFLVDTQFNNAVSDAAAERVFGILQRAYGGKALAAA
ncbi:MAG: hypothetical protein K2X82_33620 [Gemmataceae bacterium]|nr:hypothetical protein [Gemmataceae bacterium]